MQNDLNEVKVFQKSVRGILFEHPIYDKTYMPLLL